MVTLAISTDAKALQGCEVVFLMDTRTTCNLLPLDVYNEMTSNLN